MTQLRMSHKQKTKTFDQERGSPNQHSSAVVMAAMKFKKFLKPKFPEDEYMLKRSSNSDGKLKYVFLLNVQYVSNIERLKFGLQT